MGMDRSGTSVVTRVIGLHGVRLPPEGDVIAARSENPKGVWESSSLAAVNVRVLAAVGSDERFPLALERGWEQDPRLSVLRTEAAGAVRRVFPTAPWAWKDPLHCLTFAFWRSALRAEPVVVLVVRNPLEIAASANRAWGREKIYGLALWERYLRQAVAQVAGLHVLVTSYARLLADPLAWSAQLRGFLSEAGLDVAPPADAAVLSYVEPGLRHASFDRTDILGDPGVTEPQRALFLALESLESSHEAFVTPHLPDETPTTEALFAERRRAFEIKRDFERQLELGRRSRLWTRVRLSRYVASARPLYAGGRRLLRALRRS